jgi:hypothetical protein
MSLANESPLVSSRFVKAGLLVMSSTRRSLSPGGVGIRRALQF